MDKRTFAFNVDAVSVKEILGSDFLELEMYCISDEYPNRNNSAFTIESMEDALETFKNKPILGYFSPRSNDFEEHNSSLAYDSEVGDYYYDYEIADGEKIIGLIRESDNIEIVEREDLSWIKITSAIWCKYSRKQVKSLLKSKKKKVSVEITVLEMHKEGDIDVIDKFTFDGVTILGKMRSSLKDCLEGIEGAHLTLKDVINSEAFSIGSRTLSFTSKKDFSFNEINEKVFSINPDIDLLYFNNDGLLFYQEKLTEDIFSTQFIINEDSIEFIEESKIKFVKGTEKYQEIVKHVFLSKADWGTKEDITIDFSEKSASDTTWGKVSKTSLRNEILAAKNYKSLVKSAYLVVEEGWMEAPSSHLKYPIAEIKDGKLVINKNGVIAASQMLAKERNRPYYVRALRKLNTLRRKLKMDSLQKKENKKKEVVRMNKKFINLDSSYKCILAGGKLALFKKDGKLFAMEMEAKDDKDVEFSEDKLCEVKLAKEYEAEDMPDEEKMSEDEMKCSEWTLDMADTMEKFEDDEEEGETDAEIDELKEIIRKKDDQLAEAEGKIHDLEEKSRREAKEKCMVSMKEMINKEERLSAKDKEELIKMVDEDKFADEESCGKEIAYSLYKKSDTFSYKINLEKKIEEDKTESAIDKAVRLVEKK